MDIETFSSQIFGNKSPVGLLRSLFRQICSCKINNKAEKIVVFTVPCQGKNKYVDREFIYLFLQRKCTF